MDERWRIPSGEQREKDSRDKDEQSDENAVIGEMRIEQCVSFS